MKDGILLQSMFSKKDKEVQVAIAMRVNQEITKRFKLITDNL